MIEDSPSKIMSNTDDIMVSAREKAMMGEEPAKEPTNESGRAGQDSLENMFNDNASVEQRDAATMMNGGLANEQANVENPTEDTVLDESDPIESTAPAEDGTTKPKAAVKLNKLHIYSTSSLEAMGIRLARIVDNRDLDEKAVQKKVASIKKVKGIISPTQLVPARKCLEQGHEVKLLDGSDVTEDTEDLDNIYVIVDGQHRDEAVRRIKVNPKEPLKFENFYYVPLIDDYIVSDLLRETNVATFPWKDRQYLNNLLMMKSESPINLDLLKEIQAHPNATTKAALHWLTLETGKTIYSRDISAAMVDDTKLAEISKVDATRFEAGKKLFRAAESSLGDKAGTTPYSDWSIDQINSKPTETVVKMAGKLADFFKWLKESSKADVYKDLKGKKATADQASMTKDAVIQLQLSNDFAEYAKSLGK